MDWLTTIIAGIAGTTTMTIFLHAWTYITGLECRMPHILGTLLTMTTKPSGKVSDSLHAIAAGYFFHFLTGIFFSIAYYLIWLYAWGMPSWKHTGYLGLASGITGVLCWYGALKLHPLAPLVKLKSYLILVFIGHFVFTAGVIGTWKVMNEP